MMRRPPFCPHRSCPCHIDPLSGECASLARRRWFKHNGFYPTLVRGPVRRFKCLVCGRGFSEQTFSLDYYVKRIIDYREVSRSLCDCSSVRAISRRLGCSVDSVTNRGSRLARQCISAHTRALAGHRLAETLTADGFESFTVSQYFPNNIHLLVGSRSQLVYFCDYVTLRRSGRMRPVQKRMRRALEKLYRAPPQALTESFTRLLDGVHHLFESRSIECLEFFTDRKREYCTALAAHRGLAPAVAEGRLVHRRIDSRVARTKDNPLFPVNYIDRQLRKDLAEHVRETVRFARNVNHCMERLWIYLMHHNLAKRYRINDPVSLDRTHAQEAGIAAAQTERATERMLGRRRFLSFEQLEHASRQVWCRQHHTPLKGVVKGALRAIRRHAGRAEVDLEALRARLGVQRLITETSQYLPKYAVA